MMGGITVLTNNPDQSIWSLTNFDEVDDDTLKGSHLLQDDDDYSISNSPSPDPSLLRYGQQQHSSSSGAEEIETTLSNITSQFIFDETPLQSDEEVIVVYSHGSSHRITSPLLLHEENRETYTLVISPLLGPKKNGIIDMDDAEMAEFVLETAASNGKKRNGVKRVDRSNSIGDDFLSILGIDPENLQQFSDFEEHEEEEDDEEEEEEEEEIEALKGGDFFVTSYHVFQQETDDSDEMNYQGEMISTKKWKDSTFDRKSHRSRRGNNSSSGNKVNHRRGVSTYHHSPGKRQRKGSQSIDIPSSPTVSPQPTTKPVTLLPIHSSPHHGSFSVISPSPSSPSPAPGGNSNLLTPGTDLNRKKSKLEESLSYKICHLLPESKLPEVAKIIDGQMRPSTSMINREELATVLSTLKQAKLLELNEYLLQNTAHFEYSHSAPVSGHTSPIPSSSPSPTPSVSSSSLSKRKSGIPPLRSFSPTLVPGSSSGVSAGSFSDVALVNVDSPTKIISAPTSPTKRKPKLLGRSLSSPSPIPSPNFVGTPQDNFSNNNGAYFTGAINSPMKNALERALRVMNVEEDSDDEIDVVGL